MFPTRLFLDTTEETYNNMDSRLAFHQKKCAFKSMCCLFSRNFFFFFGLATRIHTAKRKVQRSRKLKKVFWFTLGCFLFTLLFNAALWPSINPTGFRCYICTGHRLGSGYQAHGDSKLSVRGMFLSQAMKVFIIWFLELMAHIVITNKIHTW
jgi:hypothetical protein